MSALDDADLALATAKTNFQAAATAVQTAKIAWWSALKKLGLTNNALMNRYPIKLIDSPVTSSADLPPLADALLNAQTAEVTAKTALDSAQAAFDQASKSAQV